VIYDINPPHTGTPANGYPSFCWSCSKPLHRLRGGAVAFEQVRDAAGHEHRVHGTCVDDAVGDGVVHVQRVAA
jgi:hypothetical protein